MYGAVGIAAEQPAGGAHPHRAPAVDEKRAHDRIDARSIHAMKRTVLRTKIKHALAVGGAAPESPVRVFPQHAGDGSHGTQRIAAEASRAGAPRVEADHAIE